MPLPTIEELRLQLEEILRGHQKDLQSFADLVSNQYGIAGTETHKTMLDFSNLALAQKSQMSQVLKVIKKIPLIHLVS